MTGNFLLVGIGKNAVAVLRRRLDQLISVVARKTPLQSKHLRTRHRQNGQRRENAFGEEGHDEAKMIGAAFYSIFIFPVSDQSRDLVQD